MSIKLVSFALTIVSLLLVMLTIRQYQRHKLSTRIFLMWLGIWLGIGIFALFPSLLDQIVFFLNMTIRLNFFLILGIFALFMIVFYLSSNITSLSRRVSKLVQENAILEYKLKKLERRKF